MSPKKYYTFMIDPEIADALKRVKQRDQLSEAEQIRQALTAWMQARGIDVTKAPTVVSEVVRSALERFTARLRKAATKGPGAADGVIVPKTLGPPCGGGKPFGALTQSQRECLNDLNGQIARQVLERGLVLASKVKRKK